MIQFKPAIKGGAIKVMHGAIEIGAIITEQGEPQFKVGRLVTLGVTDMIRCLRNMGVKIEAGIEAKIEAAQAKQTAVAAQARALQAAAKSRPKAPAKPKPRARAKAK